MMNTPRSHGRIIDLCLFGMILIFMASAFSSCEETCYDDKLNQDEEAIDCGGVCVPCDTTDGTCFDGIQNQGEEGVDCGGPCSECVTDSTILSPDFICVGTGGSSYFPLSDGSYWIYEMPNNQWFQLEVMEQVEQSNGETYTRVLTTGAFGTINDHFREEGGQVYKWNSALAAEEVYIPANPAPGMQWTTAATDSIVIESISASLNSQNGCSYENLLEVVSYSGGNGASSYYKQGLGLVELSSSQAYLDSAVVY